MSRTCTYQSTRGQMHCTECGSEVHLCTCQFPDEIAQRRLWNPEGRMFSEVMRYLEGQAVFQMKASTDNLVNLFFEATQLAVKLRDHRGGKNNVVAEDIHRACVRAAAAAVLVSICGDADYPYEPSVIYDREDGPR